MSRLVNGYDPDLVYHQKEVHCQFCKKPISVKVAEIYIGDPNGIYPMASCDRCADLRVERNKIERAIGLTAAIVAVDKFKGRPINPKAQETLVSLTQSYARLISKWHHLEGCVWDNECVRLILDKPHKWDKIIETLWRLFNDWQREQEAQPA